MNRIGAPGLTWRFNKDGTKRAYWMRGKAGIDHSFEPAVALLWRGVDPTEAEAKDIARECNRLQHEKLTSRRFPKIKKARRALKRGYIYFIEGAGLVKIGYAKDVRARLFCLQTGSPVSLTLIGVMRGSPVDEMTMHSRFAHLRSHGEWFTLSPEIQRAIEDECEGGRIGNANEPTSYQRPNAVISSVA